MIHSVEVMSDHGRDRKLSLVQCVSSNSILSIAWCRTLCPCGNVLVGNGQRTVRVKD